MDLLRDHLRGRDTRILIKLLQDDYESKAENVLCILFLSQLIWNNWNKNFHCVGSIQNEDDRGEIEQN